MKRKGEIALCLNCHSRYEITRGGQKYCSSECQIKKYKPLLKYAKTCQRCGKRFHTASKNQRFCGQSCAQKTNQELANYGQDVCVRCSKTFKKRTANARYCSKKCLMHLAHKKYKSKNLNTIFSCETCKKDFLAYVPQSNPTAYTKKTFSRECQRIYTKKLLNNRNNKTST